MSDSSPQKQQRLRASARPVKAEASQEKQAAKKRSSASGGAGNGEPTPQKILQAFAGNIEPVTPTLLYRLNALLVCIVMILLPLIYIGIIGLVIWGVYFHAVNSLGLFEVANSGSSGRNRGRGMVFMALVYLAPIVIGGILIVFMFKPLFSRPVQPTSRRSLKREKEPLLFMFVDRLCEVVGAPAPVQINLDIQVNASASFRRGWLSLFGNDLVLTIGMPLIAGLSLRQFSGILAHEFGHFSQSAGMRLSFIIRSINMWFVRVVYERDEWDERLEHLSQSLDLRVSWILYLARLFIWLTRKILWALMMVGHLVSGFLMRQMEFDADRYEARLVGSRCFAATSKRLNLLGVASQAAYNDLNQFYAEGRLVDNFPALININMKKLPDDLVQAIEARTEEEKTGWFDTHPATLERIASVQNEEAEGIFRLKAPATVLLSDYSREAKFVTRDFYYGVFGRKIKPAELHSIDELLVRQEEESKMHKAVQRYFQGAINPNRPLQFSEHNVQLPEDAKKCAEELKKYREQVLTYRKRYEKRVDEFREEESKSVSVNVATVTLRANIKLKADDEFLRSLNSYDKTVRAGAAIDRKKGELRPDLEKYETLVVRRLERALQLFLVPKVQARIPESAEWERDLKDLLITLVVINSQIGRLWELHSKCTALQVLMHFFDQMKQDEKYCEVVMTEMENLEQLLTSIHTRFKRLPYPFEHSKVDISIADFALSHEPESNNPGQLLGAAEALFENLMSLNHRSLGKLCLMGEQVEQLLGLEILPEYEEKQAESEV